MAVVPAAGVIGEAMVALVLAAAMIEKFGGDSLPRNEAQLRRLSRPGEEFLMIYPIVKYGQPVLEQKGAEVAEFDTPELHQLIEDMFESMYAAKGVGLAAPQIGIGKRLAVIDITSGEDPAQKMVLINPVIVKTEGSQNSEEGCLSLPTFREQVTRPRS